MPNRSPASTPNSSPGPRRRRRQVLPRRSEQIGIALLAVAFVGSALAFGAQQASTLVVVALLSAASGVLLGGSEAPRGGFLLLALAAYTLFQLVPLPLSLVRHLSPSSAAVWEGALRPLREPAPTWISLSVDPAGTALESLKWFAYACLFVAVTGWRTRRGPLPVALLIFCCSVVVTLVTLAHGIFDVQRIYGIYKPLDLSPWLRGPFVNGNNLAGYVNVGLFAGLGLSLSPERKLPGWPFALGVPLLVAQVLLSESRGGCVALLCGALFFGIQALRRGRALPRAALVGTAAAFGVGSIAAMVGGGARVWNALTDTEMKAKVSAWKWSLDLIRDFPVFGVGRGAFEPAFEPYRRLLGRDWTIVFPYTENFVLQWLADWGLFVGAAGLVGAALLARRPVILSVGDPLTSGLVAGLGTLLLQNLVDLGLEIFAVAALAVVTFAAILERKAPEKPRRVRPAWVGSAGVVLSVVIVLSTGASPARIERQQFSKKYSDWVARGTPDPKGFLRDVRAAMLRHPGEAYFPLVGSVAARKIGQDPMRWIGRALERSPYDGHAHLLLADLMAARKSPRQALLHLRLSALYDGVLRDLALRKAAGLARTPADLVSAFPPDLPGGGLLPEVCKRALGPLRVGCWREALARTPANGEARQELAGALLDSLETATAPCSGPDVAACTAELRRVLGERADANDWRVSELVARELALGGEHARAAKLLLDRCPANTEAAACSERAFDFGRRAKDLGLMGGAAERYEAVACVEPKRCAAAHVRMAQGYSELGAFATALRHFTSAANVDPTADRWIESAEAAARAGSAVSAHVAFDRARREGALSPEQLRRIADVEAMLASAPLPK